MNENENSRSKLFYIIAILTGLMLLAASALLIYKMVKKEDDFDDDFDEFLDELDDEFDDVIEEE